jgi:hypothetical protein
MDTHQRSSRHIATEVVFKITKPLHTYHAGSKKITGLNTASSTCFPCQR